MSHRGLVRPAPEPWKPSRCCFRIFHPLLAKVLHHLPLFPAGKTYIHGYEDREHDGSGNCGPLEQKADHNENETGILRVANVAVGARYGELLCSLCHKE